MTTGPFEPSDVERSDFERPDFERPDFERSDFEKSDDGIDEGIDEYAPLTKQTVSKSARAAVREDGNDEIDGEPAARPVVESTFLEAARDRRYRRRRTAVIVLGLGLLILLFLGMTSGKRAIENSIRRDATKTLADSDFVGVRVAVSGDEVKLSGSVASREKLDEAKQLITGIKLVGSVDTKQLTIRSGSGSGLLGLHATYNEGALTLAGVSPGTTAEKAIMSAAQKGLGNSRVVNQFTASTSVTKEADIASYESLGVAFARFPAFGVRSADIVVDDKALTIRGSLADDSTKAALLDQLRVAAGSLPVIDQLSAESSVPSASTVVGGVTTSAAGPKGSTTAGSTTGGSSSAGSTSSQASTTTGDSTTLAGGAASSTKPDASAVTTLPVRSAASAEVLAATQSQLTDLLVKKRIEFTTDSSALSNTDKAIIKQVADLVLPLDVTVEVGGHTDSRGKPERNQQLSQRRADAVRAELVRLGVPASSVTATGFGSTRLLAPDDATRGNPKNRRIEVIVKSRTP
jgi:OmpA-OmpF porin, OOP family